jgi:hypothetical protein
MDGLPWVEFDGFESRLLISSEEAPLALITLQFYGDLAREAPLIEKIEALLGSRGYREAEQFFDDEQTA